MCVATLCITLSIRLSVNRLSGRPCESARRRKHGRAPGNRGTSSSAFQFLHRSSRVIPISHVEFDSPIFRPGGVDSIVLAPAIALFPPRAPKRARDLIKTSAFVYARRNFRNFSVRGSARSRICGTTLYSDCRCRIPPSGSNRVFPSGVRSIPPANSVRQMFFYFFFAIIY